MSNERWLTKEDIMKDLAQVTGQNVANIDDRFAVSGERPPPVIVPDEDSEYTQMYGEYTTGDISVIKPDLTGIQDMLRMVNEYNDLPTYNNNDNIKELMQHNNTVITISKINPNAPEFVPKNLNNKNKDVQNGNSHRSETDSIGISTSSSNDLNIKNTVCKDDDGNNKTDASQKNETNCVIDVNKKIDVSSLSSNEIEDMKEKLKLKIVNVSKADCFKKKRERNLAMATLLKLHTYGPISTDTNSSPKLMKPEDFKTVPEDVLEKSNITERKQNIESNLQTLEKDVKRVSNTVSDTNDTSDSPRTSQESRQSGNKIPDTELEEPTNILVASKEIQESVKKVNRWLNGPEKKQQKSQPILFGPVTFKRKGTGSVNSSESPTLTNVNIERPPSAPTEYVPSSYANELTKKYMERSQAREVQIEDMWTKVERQLKEKDNEIKKRQLTTKVRK